MPLDTTAIVRSALTNYEAIFKKAVSRALDDASMKAWDMVTYKDTSNSIRSEYPLVLDTPQLAEIAHLTKKESSETGYVQISATEYGALSEIKRRDIESDRLGVLAPIVERYATNAVFHPLKLLATHLEDNAVTDIDGVALFSADHWSSSHSNNDNTTAQGGASAANIITALNTGINLIKSFCSDKGEPMNVGPSNFTLMVPTSLQMYALQALNQTILSTGEQNVYAGTGYHSNNVNLVINPYLAITGTPANDVFYLFAEVAGQKPIVHKKRAARIIKHMSGDLWELNNKAYFGYYIDHAIEVPAFWQVVQFT